MSIYNDILTYWYKCVEYEDFIGGKISLNSKNTLLAPLNYDPFIFKLNNDTGLCPVENNKELETFYSGATLQNSEIYYGYPLLFYYDKSSNPPYTSQELFVTPLFVISIKLTKKDSCIQLEKEEEIPSCSIKAFSQLGLRVEEISGIGKIIEEIFKNGYELDSKDLVDKTIKAILEETNLEIIETINPEKLTNNIDKNLNINLKTGLYNKSIIYNGERSSYNNQLLPELLDLTKRSDFNGTALTFITDNVEITNKKEQPEDLDKKYVPILPFVLNDYQVEALSNIFNNKISVITGPPGTGKSQFIMDLIINLFFKEKSVLFVSNNNTAVNVVNDRINEKYENLILRTGNKREYLSAVKEKFDKLLVLKSKIKSFKETNIEQLANVWREIITLRKQIAKVIEFEKNYENKFFLYENKAELFSELYSRPQLEENFKYLNKTKINQIIEITEKINKLKTDRISLFIKIILIFKKDFLENKRLKLLKELNDLLGEKIVNILNNSVSGEGITELNETLNQRLNDFILLYNLKIELASTQKEIEKYPDKRSFIDKIEKLKRKYNELSVNYVKENYLDYIFKEKQHISSVNQFLNSLTLRSYSKIDNPDLFLKTLAILKVWSCTLKSLKDTFPLKSCIFDYVIFDEASQVDLPSAAPALYRAKNAIIVGDPMQLTHIAAIPDDIDRKFAQASNLIDKVEVYPYKIQYKHTSLYESAKNSIKEEPILLANHYRSVDPIITLCNRVFYQGILNIRTDMDFSIYPTNLPRGIEWIDCKGEVNKSGRSRSNYEESKKVLEILQFILKNIEGLNLNIGIVTPYSAQEDLISNLVQKNIPSELIGKHQIIVNTAHKFQGSEKDIMIFSLVLAQKGNANSDTWFNGYPQILNVALSRARYLLYIIGDKDYCYSRKRRLTELVKNYDQIKKESELEEMLIAENFDTHTEKFLYENLINNIDFLAYGYQLKAQLFYKRYFLDLALIGEGKNSGKKINIECDGYQHEIIGGLPVIEDLERDRYLEKEGWEVLRFKNHEILSNTKEVIVKIESVIKGEKTEIKSVAAADGIKNGLGTEHSTGTGSKQKEPATAIEPLITDGIKDVKTSIIEFDFIKDKDRRQILERDHEELQNAFNNKLWTSVYVLGGRVLENLLISVLETNKEGALNCYNQKYNYNNKDFKPKISRWEFWQLIEVCRALNYLDENTKSLALFIKENRNLVHSSKEIDDEISPTEETSIIIVESLEMIIKRLKNKLLNS